MQDLSVDVVVVVLVVKGETGQRPQRSRLHMLSHIWGIFSLSSSGIWASWLG